MENKREDTNYSFAFSLLTLLLITTDLLLFHHSFMTKIIEGYEASLFLVVLADWLLLVAQKMQMLQSVNVRVKRTIGRSIEQMKKNVRFSPPGEMRKKQRGRLLELNQYDRHKDITIFQNEVNVQIVKTDAKLFFFWLLFCYPWLHLVPLLTVLRNGLELAAPFYRLSYFRLLWQWKNYCHFCVLMRSR